jgi:hypothetical protein
MNAAFDRDALLDPFDQIGRAAAKAGTKLQIAVYGGAARMLASNFRFATEDVDVSELGRPLPDWLGTVVHQIAEKNGWQDDWFNDGVGIAKGEWMCPNTLADTVDAIQAGSARDEVLAEFVDTFDAAKTDRDRYASIEREPKLTGDERVDALVGAVAEYLAKQRRLGRVPRWVSNPARRLSSPWFTTASPSDAMREYLTFASPAEFASRNIFTEELPLRRARGPQPAKTT